MGVNQAPRAGPLHALTARQAMRWHARSLLHEPTDAQIHLARLKASLALVGAEPVQGALADLFHCFGAADAPIKREALQLVRGRLAVHVVRWFEAQAAQAALPAITPLATRWSVLTQPCADISTRARRCSADDSRWLADQAVAAFHANDASAQNGFLHHCVTCHDKLAFMLARRALLKSGTELPDDWAVVSVQLEDMRESL